MNPVSLRAGGPAGSYRCSPAARARYARRLSGPLLDRFDLRVDVAAPEPALLLDRAPREPRAAARGTPPTGEAHLATPMRPSAPEA